MNTVLYNPRRFTSAQYYFTKTHTFCHLVDRHELGTHSKYQAFLSLSRKIEDIHFLSFMSNRAFHISYGHKHGETAQSHSASFVQFNICLERVVL